jgi:purine-binding chemotaxis protein CheW
MHEGTHQLVVFRLGDEHYALGIEQVHEIIRFAQPRSIVSRQPSVLGVISLRGKIVPVHDIATILGVMSERGEEAKIVIVAAGEDTAGLVVDDVEEVLTIDQAQHEPVPGGESDLVDSIVKVGDRLVIQLELDAIFEEQLVAA